MGLLLPIAANASTPRIHGVHHLASVDFWVDTLNSYNYYWTSIGKDYVISIDVEVTSGSDIDFYILDEDNYDLWSDGSSSYAEVIRQNVGSISLSFKVPVSGEWHLLFINDNWLFRKHIEGTITAVAPVAANDVSDLGTAVAAIIVVVVIIVCTISYLSKYEKRRQQAQHGYQPAYQQVQTGFCPYCGAPRQLYDAQFCSRCGRPFRGPDLG
jgi:hypothetical protein